MTKGRLSRRGNAWAVVIPADIRRELQWWPGDEIELRPLDGNLMLSNATQHGVQLVKRKEEYADQHRRRR